ncbi:Biogenesis of lysosome-related organelles complex 1 subunit 4 [Varanus komodoensis]|uniref:Biogenesis of lysosomal organelles complex 1 subunit 4 n=1 Tax=Varanus komodoensis TaxID=61221 RepID=A0A8D2KUL7_VARKO|nr:biogenesis of lysosome-related organelles complex 1 subunit 4 isoform X1 [Varanus komodoensis]KAF7245211.1 Biogenesis of lysosome-related organelles complex 1 subunit 4 [Varanus komodoensis]
MDGAAAAAEEPPLQLSGDSGNVSQSHSSTSGLGDEDAAGEDALGGELLLAAAATDYSAYVLPSPLGGAASAGQIETLDKSLEDLLTRVDEFVGMLDMIRNDSSQVINESIPHIHTKAIEMRQLYRKIDKLEAFVKMVGNNVAGLEEQIIKAESDLGMFSNSFKKLLHTINVPSFLHKSSSSRQNQTLYEPPELFKTEEYFPFLGEAQHL